MSKLLLAFLLVCVFVTLSVDARRWRKRKWMLNRGGQHGDLSNDQSIDDKFEGGKRKWRRHRWMKMSRLDTSAEQTDDKKNDTSDADDFQTRRQKWRVMKRQRKMKWHNRRYGPPDNDDDNTPDDVTAGPFHRRRHHNWPQKGKMWRKFKKFNRRMHKHPNCFCLKPDQLKKIKELLEEDGLEDEFPQFFPPGYDNDKEDDDDSNVDVDDDDEGETVLGVVDSTTAVTNILS